MHGVQFDPRTGELRVTREDFAVLAAVARAGPRAADPKAAARLRAADAMSERAVHPALRAVLAAVNRPVCEFRLDRRSFGGRSPAGARHAVGWVDAHLVAMLTDRQRDPRWDLATVHPTFLPSTVARFAGLGPRSRGGTDAPVGLRGGALERLLALPPAADVSAVAELLDPADRAAAGVLRDAVMHLRARWSLEVRWDGPRERTARRSLDVLDSDSGLWVVRRDGATRDFPVLLMSATPTQVWRLLTTLLPTADELAMGAT